MKKQLTYLQHSTSGVNKVVKAVLHSRLLAGLLILALFSTPARAQNYSWATKTTNTSGKTAVAAATNGDSYVLTSFTNTTTVGNKTFTSYGGTDLLLIRYNANKTVDWIIRIGGSGDEQVGDVELQQSEATIAVTGSFSGKAKIENGNPNLIREITSAGGTDVFVARFIKSTAYPHWVQRAGGPLNDYGYGIDADQYDNLYVTGAFSGTASFHGALSQNYLSSDGNSSDIFLTKYDKGGKVPFARRIGGPGFDFGSAVEVHPVSGDIYLTGGYAPAGYPYNTNVIVARLTASGVVQWTKVAGTGTTVDAGNDIVIYNQGAAVTGYFGGSITFGNTTLTSSGPADVFVAYFPADVASPGWAKRYGGTGADEGHSLTKNSSERLLLAGIFSGTATFGATTATAKGGAADRDMFFCSLSINQVPDWVKIVGSTGVDYGRGSIALAVNSTIFFTGHAGGNTTLDKISLSGAGNLLARIDLPTVTGYKLVNAVTDTDIKTFLPDVEYNYMLLGTDKINIRVNTLDNSVGSVKFVLDGVTVGIDNTAPFTLAGDAPKTGGGTDYASITPAPGLHKLAVIPYSGPNGTGLTASFKEMGFLISNKPILVDLTLVNALTDGDIQPMKDYLSINCSVVDANQFSIRANTNPGVVGSVKFVVDGVERIENNAPYASAGDVPKTGGGTDYTPTKLAFGAHKIVVTAYTGANATGTASNVIAVNFYIAPGDAYRKMFHAAEPEAQPVNAAFTVAPNPFSQTTLLSFTTAVEGPATVEVYNAQGMLIQRLYEGILRAATPYSWHFDGKQLPAGVYISRIRMGKQVYHQRLVLTR